jgi:YHS domain-containing protein
MRGPLVMAALLVLIFVLSRLPALWRPRPPLAAPTRRDELVKDPVCQTYVVMSRAIRSESGGAPTFFCSRECAARFERGERRA